MLHNFGSQWQILLEWRYLKVKISFSSSPSDSQNLPLHKSLNLAKETPYQKMHPVDYIYSKTNKG